ncbi:MAG: hypothetical protein LBS67_04685, partial [Clostridiales Family XIII bacterium]|nr:hypothetical protein [Clostridiales Family XIII bacterium]
GDDDDTTGDDDDTTGDDTGDDETISEIGDDETSLQNGNENGTTVTPNDGDSPTMNILGNEVPLFGKAGDTTSLGLVNILCLLVMLFIAVRSAVKFIAARRRGRISTDAYYDVHENARTSKVLSTLTKFFSIEMGIVALGVAFFFLTEDLSGTLTVTDSFSGVQAAATAAVIVLHHIAFRDITAKVSHDAAL